jgi:hypothetical protein
MCDILLRVKITLTWGGPHLNPAIMTNRNDDVDIMILLVPLFLRALVFDEDERALHRIEFQYLHCPHKAQSRK